LYLFSGGYMTAALARDPIYRRRRFPAEAIELCVRWYLTYRLSYRDLAAMMAERGINVSHTTILRWVLRYVPEYESAVRTLLISSCLSSLALIA
jgi:transposase-like protein